MDTNLNPQSQNENVSPEMRTSTYNDYAAAVAEIVLKVHRLSSFLPMPPNVRDKTVNDWIEILWSKVPLEGLYPSYRNAMAKHKDGPFRPGHIIAEWETRKASLPVIQTECLFCPRLMEDPSAPGSCVGDPTLPQTCPFHSAKEVH